MLGILVQFVPKKTVTVDGVSNDNSLCSQILYIWRLPMLTQVTTCRLEFLS